MALTDEEKQAGAEFAQRMKVLRGNRTQRAFAEEVGAPLSNVNRYEAGTFPSYPFLRQIATKMGVSLNWLVLGRGRPYLPKPRKQAVR